ncbi:hypothetical protein L9F63_002026 [Diploptera punctata]|uniref:Sulfatase N-terminal domain-containing protein n=1 Tax=Diploptera punctata TaxID=6984 RepID=A0AAD8A3F7_DIPPU|nr:hypothetical protein L9F63_002026 [Diploptera punctata]
MQALSVFIFSFLLSGVSSLQPNIVVIMADDLGWNDVGFHGTDQIPTPNIDALAYSGVILNRHYTLPTCTPSRSAFMTGKYPIRTGMQGNPIKCGEPRGLPLEEILLPQRLQKAGYITRLVGKWHLGYHHSEYTPTKRGFHSHFGYFNGYIGYFDHKIDQGDFIGYDLHRDLNVSWIEHGKYATEIFTQEAVDLILSHDISKPLFLQVAHLAVHSGRDSQLLEVPNVDEAHNKFKYIKDPQRRLYAEMTSRLDESVGEIVTALKDKGILNNSIIIFLSDNGAQTIGMHQNWGSNWPLRGLKFTPYEGAVRGVTALWSPLLKNPHRVSSHLMHIVDWYPTIYAMTGGDISDLGEIDGINQWSHLIDDSNSTTPRKDMLINIEEENTIEGIIDGKWKLVLSTYNNGSYDNYFGEDGRGLPNPAYSIHMVLVSNVFKSLQSVQSNNINNINQMVNKIKQLRKEATINCQETERKYSEGPYCSTYCLFDIENDPCEEKNIVLNYPIITEHLKNKLKTFRSLMVPELNKPVSSAANPKFYNNSWVSWLDEKYINQSKFYAVKFSVSEAITLKVCISYFLFLLIFIYL